MSPERNPAMVAGIPEFQMEGFDIDAAFQGAIADVASNEELELNEKITRMENIISESSSEVYRDFVDFHSMAAQMEVMCNHNHVLNSAMESSDTLSSFRTSFADSAEHNHKHESSNDKVAKEKSKTKKKKKKMRRGWLALLDRD